MLHGNRKKASEYNSPRAAPSNKVGVATWVLSDGTADEMRSSWVNRVGTNKRGRYVADECCVSSNRESSICVGSKVTLTFFTTSEILTTSAVPEIHLRVLAAMECTPTHWNNPWGSSRESKKGLAVTITSSPWSVWSDSNVLLCESHKKPHPLTRREEKVVE